MTVVVSNTAGSTLALVGGSWVVRFRDGHPDVTDLSEPSFWPLLENDPLVVRAEVDAAGGPPLPVELVVESALRSGSSYWQGRSSAWIAAFAIDPSSSAGDAAAELIAARQGEQRTRQQLQRWLRQRPAR